jgi:hypothetical protein
MRRSVGTSVIEVIFHVGPSQIEKSTRSALIHSCFALYPSSAPLRPHPYPRAAQEVELAAGFVDDDEHGRGPELSETGEL